MKSFTLRLPKRLMAVIEAEAEARNVSKSDVVRARLEESAPAPTGQEAILSILESAWSSEVPAEPAVFRSGKKQKLADVIRGKKRPR